MKKKTSHNNEELWPGIAFSFFFFLNFFFLMVWTTNKARICQQLITTELELKKVFEHIDSTNSLCQTNYKKRKKKKKVNSNAKVVGVIFFLVVFTSQHVIFVFLPDSLQHCISSRQLVFCQNSFRIFKSFFKMFSLLLASETILLCISIWKTITIPKKKIGLFLWKDFTPGVGGYL